MDTLIFNAHFLYKNITLDLYTIMISSKKISQRSSYMSLKPAWIVLKFIGSMILEWPGELFKNVAVDFIVMVFLYPDAVVYSSEPIL
jgi:hypothetical protein